MLLRMLSACAPCIGYWINPTAYSGQDQDPSNETIVGMEQPDSCLAAPVGAGVLHLRELRVLRCELRVLRCAVLFRETERLWENWLITKTAFPSPGCDMSCARLVK